MRARLRLYARRLLRMFYADTSHARRVAAVLSAMPQAPNATGSQQAAAAGVAAAGGVARGNAAYAPTFACAVCVITFHHHHPAHARCVQRVRAFARVSVARGGTLASAMRRRHAARVLPCVCCSAAVPDATILILGVE